jgi:xanthine dehydrogenase YagS FAD-binding subunit
MKTFAHYNARSIEEAVGLLTEYKGKAKLNAGGTDLLGLLKDSILPDYPEAIINIKTITGLDTIKADTAGLKIGALSKLADIARSPAVKEKYPLLSEAAHSVATPLIRNVATIGGNLAQDVRCWYYRYPHQIGGPVLCRRKGGKTCNALAGDNRYHSLFGAAHGCVAVNPSDIGMALIALDANIVTSQRTIAAPAFFHTGAIGSTVLAANELVTEIQIPPLPAGVRQHFRKFTLREPVDFAIVSVASVITIKSGICADARIVLGAVAPAPVRAGKAEEIIKGRPIDEANADEAATAALLDAKPLSRNAYKVEIARTLVKRAILMDS